MMLERYINAMVFVYAINELNTDELKYEYISGTNNYEIDDYNNSFRLPVTDNLGISGVNWKLVTKSIMLPTVMPTIGISYHGTFEGALITTEDTNGKIIFGQKEISTYRLFVDATFFGCENGLTIQDSWLRANAMFFDSRELRKVTFDNCRLGDMKYLFTHSDVEDVIFKKCSLLDCDQNRNYKDVGADKVFSAKMKTLTLKNCDTRFVDTIVGMFEDMGYPFGNLEINIID